MGILRCDTRAITIPAAGTCAESRSRTVPESRVPVAGRAPLIPVKWKSKVSFTCNLNLHHDVTEGRARRALLGAIGAEGHQLLPAMATRRPRKTATGPRARVYALVDAGSAARALLSRPQRGVIGLSTMLITTRRWRGLRRNSCDNSANFVKVTRGHLKVTKAHFKVRRGRKKVTAPQVQLSSRRE
jgi:hypothetical protein